ncbi:hypothetical protein HSB1_14820 [Halogranum salarium B-1]|uniref:Uncharacterized protein n=1 Tax=Halogranum salarium B-1 TaxID=1210908 RepID=J3JHC8_9EURY|nr:hypothetical protein HSB1_14820 [Halogranum salarium B-1]
MFILDTARASDAGDCPFLHRQGTTHTSVALGPFVRRRGVTR